MGQRKPLIPKKVKTKASVEPLLIEDMVLTTETSKSFYLKRLKYKGVPNLIPTGMHNEHSFSTKTIDMKRDSLIRMVYSLLNNRYGITEHNAMYELSYYLRYLDENGLTAVEDDFFHSDLTHQYINKLNEQAKAGMISSKNRSAHKMLSFFLKITGRKAEAKKLPEAPVYAKSTQGLDIETEIKPAAKSLFRAYAQFVTHIQNGTRADIHPIYDEARFNEIAKKNGWSNQQIKHKQGGIISAVHSGPYFIKGLNSEDKEFQHHRAFKNQAVRCALMLCFLLTGANLTPMLTMRRKDVKFKQLQGDRYVFETQKTRAGGKAQDNALGFSKHTRKFIESWLELSKNIASDDKNEWLFPYLNRDGSVENFTKHGTNPYNVNKMLDVMGYASFNSRNLRQTKADTLMKVTEDVYLVSLSLNNKLKTVASHYSNGLEQDHQRNLAATMDAKMSIAKGKDIKESVLEAKFKFKDVLSEYDYKQRLRPASYTPSGIRCEGDKSLEDQVKRQLKTLKVSIPEEEEKCTNFLSCFECDNHVLVAAVNDIWLMLSFFDVIQELKNCNAINSLPKEELFKLEVSIEAILKRFKEKDVSNYKQAEEKHRESMHPLYSDIRSIDDLKEAFG